VPSPEMDGLIDLLVEQRKNGAILARPLEIERANIDLVGKFYPLADDVVVTEVQARGVPGVWLDSEATRSDRVVLYLHGGAYVIGSSLSHRELAARIGRVAGARTLALDYRLGPENKFPAAVEDAVSAYRFLIEDLGLAPSKVALAGDSAGGGLTAATLVAIRDQHLPAPSAAVLLSPWLDLTVSGQSAYERAERDPICTPERLLQAARDYLGAADAREPLASPMFAELSGLPPLLILVGTIEVLYDDSVRFAAKAKEAGVDVELEVGEGLPHVWPFMAGTPEAGVATEDIGRFLTAHLG
jgi:monoterpene epsilon-lactone hydrolase